MRLSVDRPVRAPFLFSSLWFGRRERNTSNGATDPFAYVNRTSCGTRCQSGDNIDVSPKSVDNDIPSELELDDIVDLEKVLTMSGDKQ